MKTRIEIFENRADFAEAMLAKYVSQAPNNIVSDIGAGFGHMKATVRDKGGVWQPFDYVRKIKESMDWNLDDPAPMVAKKAGTVIFLEVLEHLPNPYLGLKNIYDHIEANGFLILTTPNPASSKNTITLLLKGQLYAFQEKHLQEHHVFTPWEHIVLYFLEQLGFELLEYCVVDTKYSKRKPDSGKDFIKKQLEAFLEYRRPKSKGMSYGMVVRKKG